MKIVKFFDRKIQKSNAKILFFKEKIHLLTFENAKKSKIFILVRPGIKKKSQLMSNVILLDNLSVYPVFMFYLNCYQFDFFQFNFINN